MEKRAKNLCVGESSKALRNKTLQKHRPQKRDKTHVLVDPRNRDRRFTPPQRHTQEPLKRNDIFI